MTKKPSHTTPSVVRRTISIALAATPFVPYISSSNSQATESTGVAGESASAANDISNVAGIMDVDRFLKLSQVLTSRSTLDPIIAARALRNLVAQDAGFSAQASELLRAISDASFSDMRTFHDFMNTRQVLLPTAMKIISAWYLGYTGTPAAMSTKDDAHFVSYAGALMYEPTIDATVIPTYSRGHTNYWANPPKTIATD